MSLDWSKLRAAVTPSTRIWWRDDDAVADTPQLDRLVRLAELSQCSIHLAIVPAKLDNSLTQRVKSTPHLRPVVHGWAHQNTAEPSEKKSEFSSPADLVLPRAAQALGVMHSAFGSDLTPMFVPPWNRISDAVAAGLAPLGYTVLSTYGPRHAQPDAGIARLNTHIDPIDWRGHRGLVNPQQLIDGAAAQLQAWPTEPIGLLSHHLVHDDSVWEMCHAMLQALLDAGARPLTQNGIIE